MATVDACDEQALPPALDPQLSPRGEHDQGGRFGDAISPFTGDAACLDVGSIVNDPTDEPFQLPAGFRQRVIARQG